MQKPAFPSCRCTAFEIPSAIVETGSSVGPRASIHDLEVALKLKTKLRFQIEFYPPGALPKEEIKTRRVTDLRLGRVGQ